MPTQPEGQIVIKSTIESGDGGSNEKNINDAKKSNMNQIIIISIAVLSGIVIIVLIVVLCCRKKKQVMETNVIELGKTDMVSATEGIHETKSVDTNVVNMNDSDENEEEMNGLYDIVEVVTSNDSIHAINTAGSIDTPNGITAGSIDVVGNKVVESNNKNDDDDDDNCDDLYVKNNENDKETSQYVTTQ
eukprot:373165_1